MSIEAMVRQTNYPILHIEQKETVLAQGAHFPNTVATADDNAVSMITYPDTGIFVLFVGSYAACTGKKYEQYLDDSRKTTKEIVFQSRNAAAQFVLGVRGKTKEWKE